MLKLEVDGAEVKRLRSSRERSATQKEFAHEVGISERRLREIENARGLIAVDVVDRLARALSVPRTQLCASVPAPASAMPSNPPEQDRFFPRFDTGIAEMVEDEAVLMDAASKAQVVLLQIKVRLGIDKRTHCAAGVIDGYDPSRARRALVKTNRIRAPWRAHANDVICHDQRTDGVRVDIPKIHAVAAEPPTLASNKEDTRFVTRGEFHNVAFAFGRAAPHITTFMRGKKRERWCASCRVWGRWFSPRGPVASKPDEVAHIAP
ncbi:MAG: helix-turn-helix transcriptional regulator [Caulobacterales bacterium]|nr:helix-turn-helix transcriptional regulator [Caulobacterales bacterium]